ncbi:MAG: hypothetical protein AAGA96_05240 [Verrucomicrobiota bacterium]
METLSELAPGSSKSSGPEESATASSLDLLRIGLVMFRMASPPNPIESMNRSVDASEGDAVGS